MQHFSLFTWSVLVSRPPYRKLGDPSQEYGIHSNRKAIKYSNTTKYKRRIFAVEEAHQLDVDEEAT